MGLLQDWYKYEQAEGEAGRVHRALDEELQFFHNVSHGHVDRIRKNIQERRFLDNNGVGTLSRDPLLNMRYHCVITTAFITRICIEHGLEPERAFRMSDFYIQQLDNTRTIEQVAALHDRMVLDFTSKMQQQRKHVPSSPPIRQCVDYIYAHINERITVADLSSLVHLSQSYLSRIFKKETGLSVSDYIRSKKIDMAKELLRYSGKSIVEIAEHLAFSSESHFIQIFRSYTNFTPKQYRTARAQDMADTKDT
jgi:AraC-like DNA-binding protein